MKSDNISVSVVLPVYISKPSNITDTVKCIELLKTKTAIPFQLVIVETCTDYFIDSAEIYIQEKYRTTANKSINRAFKVCDTDYVVFIGNDVMVSDNWLESLISCFDIDDCGIATLGNNEHGDIQRDEIKEEMYFSIAMFKKEDAWFDDFYTFIFDDTDMIFRIYVSGRKCYKNLNTIVQHKPHSTLGEFCGNKAEYDRCREYFRDKWKDHKDNPMYERLG